MKRLFLVLSLLFLVTALLLATCTGEEKPYNCGTYHTTGYSLEGNQDDIPGLIGT